MTVWQVFQEGRGLLKNRTSDLVQVMCYRFGGGGGGGGGCSPCCCRCRSHVPVDLLHLVSAAVAVVLGCWL